jgi:hypothetical protein
VGKETLLDKKRQFYEKNEAAHSMNGENVMSKKQSVKHSETNIRF